MTREEAICVIQAARPMNGPNSKMINDALDFAIAALRDQDERRWIPVAERLPGNDDFVLVIVSGKVGKITLDNAIELASFSMDEGWILEMWPEWEDPKVTYWMPLPEPPKEAANAKMQ